MPRIPFLTFALTLASVLTLSACSEETCGVAGTTQACLCPTGAMGAQSCQADRTFSPCGCESSMVDAGTTRDATMGGGSDAGVRDAGMGGGSDAGADAGSNLSFEILGFALTGGGPNEAGDAELGFIGRRLGVSLEGRIQNAADCEGCRVQVLLGVGEYRTCLFDDVPLAGVFNSGVDFPVDTDTVFTMGTGRYEVMWKVTQAVDCSAGLAQYDDATIEGVLGTVDVRHEFGPHQAVVMDYEIPAGADPSCFDVACPEGTFALGGGGFFGSNHVETFAGIAEPELGVFRRCVAPKRPDVNAVSARLWVRCSAVAAGEVNLRTRTVDAVDGVPLLARVRCPSGQQVIGGGWGWPSGWEVQSREPVLVDPNGLDGWDLRGVGGPDPVRWTVRR
jgi:hypothetical protein